MTALRTHRTDGRRRPLVALALAHMAGLWIGMRAVAPEAWGTAALVALLASAFLKRRAPAAPLLFSAVFFLGGFHAALHRPGVSRRDLQHLLEAPRETLRIAGRVTDDPVYRSPDFGSRERLAFTLHADRLYRILPGWQKCRGTVRVVVHGDGAGHERARYGDRVMLDGVLSRDPPHVLHVYAEEVERLSAGHGSAAIALAYRWRARSLERIARSRQDAGPGVSGVLQAMLLGHRADLPADVREIFQVTGAMHILAISGLHVGVVLVFLLGFLRLTRLSRRYWVLALAPVLLAYMTAAGLPRSAIRATVMALVYWAAPLFGRRPDALSAVAFAALSILLVDPTSLSDPGFIFSFSIVTGLLVLTPPLRRAWEWNPAQVDDWAPDGPGLAVRLARSARRRAWDLVLISFVAWLVSLPLMARYANVFAPVGLIANLLLVPAACAVVWSGGLALLLDALFPWAAEAALSAARMTAGLLIRFLGRLASLPGGHFFVSSPPLAAVAAWVAWLFAVLRYGGRPRRIALASSALAALLAGGIHLAPGPLRIEIGGASPGGGALVQTPDGHRLFFDPGPAFRSEQVIRRLRSRGVNRIDTLVLTRADARHMGATLGLADAVRIREVWVPDFAALSRVYRETISELASRGIRVHFLSAGDRIESGRVLWEVWHPSEASAGPRADQNDLVLRLTCGSREVVFAGSAVADIAHRIEADMRKDPASPRHRALIRNPSPWEDMTAWGTAVSPDLLIYPGEFHAVSDISGPMGEDTPWRRHAAPASGWIEIRSGPATRSWILRERGGRR